MELRNKIIEAIDASWTEADDLDPFAAADAILSIPEIAEALEAQAALVRADLVVHEGELHHLIRPDNA